MVDCVRFVNSWFTSNTYIISHPNYDDIWVVDPGDVLPVYEWMTKHEKKSVAGILLTHAHFDHMYGINDILKVFPQATVYTSNDYGRELLCDAKKNASHYTEMGPVVIDKNATIQYYTPEQFLWAGVRMKVYHTPGHSDDSVCLLIAGKLFTGDTLIKDVRTVTKLKGGSVEKLGQTIALLESFKGNNLIIYAGHESPFQLDGYDLTIATRIID